MINQKRWLGQWDEWLSTFDVYTLAYSIFRSILPLRDQLHRPLDGLEYLWGTATLHRYSRVEAVFSHQLFSGVNIVDSPMVEFIIQ